MSEYQYYEFQAVDRTLTDKEMDELGEMSTRAEITRSSFTNTYHYGDFRGNPRKMMEKYFDAFVYVTNWGTHEFMLRLPRGLVDEDALKEFQAEGAFSLWTTREHVLFKLGGHIEPPGGWEEGENWMSELLPLRDDLMAG